ncbi:hypothetical protein FA15DRAFT_651672 [Coprinopsis marcescibilis]|uniref:Uncharacterized protein n=1 Tax=Coprinopsis marcescibilis TaxID=230819 RepID=A0A5C3LBC6_COPMA|nr:hypothetical protein FA15DRAFT_651672 [Coprinopsis marcescibilis]
MALTQQSAHKQNAVPSNICLRLQHASRFIHRLWLDQRYPNECGNTHPKQLGKMELVKSFNTLGRRKTKKGNYRSDWAPKRRNVLRHASALTTTPTDPINDVGASDELRLGGILKYAINVTVPTKNKELLTAGTLSMNPDINPGRPILPTGKIGVLKLSIETRIIN